MYNAILSSQKPSKFRGSSITISAIFGNFGISGNLRLLLLLFVFFFVAAGMFFDPFCNLELISFFLSSR
jgi:hypothetical protein